MLTVGSCTLHMDNGGFSSPRGPWSMTPLARVLQMRRPCRLPSVQANSCRFQAHAEGRSTHRASTVTQKEESVVVTAVYASLHGACNRHRSKSKLAARPPHAVLLAGSAADSQYHKHKQRARYSSHIQSPKLDLDHCPAPLVGITTVHYGTPQQWWVGRRLAPFAAVR